MRKKIGIKFIALLLPLVLLTGCKNNDIDELLNSPDNTNQNLIPATDQSTTELDNIGNNSFDSTDAVSVIEAFLSSVKHADFDTAYSLLNIPEDAICSKEDLEFNLRRGSLSYLIGGSDDALLYDYTIANYDNGSSACFYTRETSDKRFYYEVTAILQNDNTFKIDYTPYIQKYVMVYVPSGVRLFIGDKEISTTNITKTQNSLDIYKLNYPCRIDYQTTLISSVFGELTGTLSLPRYDFTLSENVNYVDEPLEVPRSVSQDLFNELATRSCDIYDNIYKMMESKEDVTALDKYIYYEKSYKFLEQYYDLGLQSRFSTNKVTGDTVQLARDVQILEYWQNPSKVSYVYSDNTIVLNMILHLYWKDISDKACEELISVGIKLSKDPGGEWLLNDITKNAWTVLTDGLDESNGIDNW